MSAAKREYSDVGQFAVCDDGGRWDSITELVGG